jgi:hypothetical protein
MGAICNHALEQGTKNHPAAISENYALDDGLNTWE